MDLKFLLIYLFLTDLRYFWNWCILRFPFSNYFFRINYSPAFNFQSSFLVISNACLSPLSRQSLNFSNYASSFVFVTFFHILFFASKQTFQSLFCCQRTRSSIIRSCIQQKLVSPHWQLLNSRWARCAQKYAITSIAH